MKLAVIRRRFSPTGGAELYAQRLVERLALLGHEVHLFAEEWSGTPRDSKLHTILAGGPRRVRARIFAEEVAKKIDGFPFDCVFSMERTMKQDVYRAGDGVHEVWLQKRRLFSPWWKRLFIGRGGFHRGVRWLEQRTLDPANTKRIIANSEMVRQEIIGNFGFPPDRIHLVRNGVETTRFSSGLRDETRERFGVKPSEFLVLFVGSGWERKGLNFLLDGLKGSPETKLLVVGKGRKPAFAPRNAIFAGPMRDVENAFAAADLLVTLPIYEPSANVVVEALAAGLPVVTSVNNGAAEMLEEGVTGSVLADFWKPEKVNGALDYWAKKRDRVQVDHQALSIERNVSETLAILELAAGEKKQ